MLERLEQAFAARTESEERLRSFLADASHELRTPLASIRGYAELFRMGAAAEPQQTAKAMRRIEEEAERMGVLVEDLLALARLDEAPDRERRLVELVELARDAVADASATAPQRAISLHAEQPVEVLADPLQLQQVLANLLRNALVHTPAATPIEVSVERHGEIARIAVRDHGPGVPRAARERLFERFWRAEPGRERGRAGAGLGLAIASAIVEAHHGQISVHDAPGGGALFVVELPAADSQSASARRGLSVLARRRALSDDSQGAGQPPRRAFEDARMTTSELLQRPVRAARRATTPSRRLAPPSSRLRSSRANARRDPRWARPALFAAARGHRAAYLWDLSASGYANSFYAAAVQAGTKSWKAFFFGSLDASNFITVDKPPASLWVMALSGRIFGFSSWSMLVPQALEGVAAVGLLYATVKRWFGAGAGLARRRAVRRDAGRRADVPLQQPRRAARAAARRQRATA